MTFIHEKEENVVRISSEKPIYDYIWPILTRLQPNPYNNFDYLKLRFAKNLTPRVFQLCSLWWNVGVVVKDLVKMDDALKIDRNKTIEGYEIKLSKIGALKDLSEEDQKNYEEELKTLFEKIK